MSVLNCILWRTFKLHCIVVVMLWRVGDIDLNPKECKMSAVQMF